MGKTGALLMLSLLLCACGNPRVNSTAAANSTATPGDNPKAAPERIEISFEPAPARGDRIRTTRTLSTRERVEGQMLRAVNRTIGVDRVLEVDQSGRLLAVRRNYESATITVREGAKPAKTQRLPNDGAELELRLGPGGIRARVLVGDEGLARTDWQLEGFDRALLPIDAVAVGDRWEPNPGSMSEMARVFEKGDFKVEKQSITCRLIAADEALAEVSVDWRISGTTASGTAVIAFAGRLEFDRQQRLVTNVSLSGGRAGDGDAITIELHRRPLKGWLDLDE